MKQVSSELLPLSGKGVTSLLHPPYFIRHCTARTALFNIGITTFSCLAHQLRNHQHLFYKVGNVEMGLDGTQDTKDTKHRNV